MSILSMYQGVEDLINGVEPTPGEANGQVDATDLAVEEVRADVAEAVAEVESLADAVEEIKEELKDQEEAVEELVEEVGGMEGLLASGQFSALAFSQKYNRALKLNAKLGGQNFSTMGAESISDAATARLAAVSGIEGFMETVKSGAKKAVEYIKHIFNTVINFFVGMFNTAAALERRQKQLAERVKGATLKDKIKLGGWNIGCDYATNGLKGLEALANHSMFELTSSTLPNFMDLGKNLDGIDAAKFKSAYGALTNDLKAVAKAVGKVSEKADASDKRTVLGSHAGFRIFAMFEEKFENDAQMVAAARSIKVSFGKTEEAKKFSTGEVATKVSTPSDLLGALGAVKSYVEEIRSSKVQQKFSKAERDRVVGTLTVASKTNESKKEGNAKAIDLVKAIFVSASGLTITMEKLYAYLARQLMDAVQAHI